MSNLILSIYAVESLTNPYQRVLIPEGTFKVPEETGR
jgi:hypothetical protein